MLYTLQNLFRAISTFSKVDSILKLGQGLDLRQAFSELPVALQEARNQLNRLDSQESDQGHLHLLGPSFADAPSIRAVSTFDPGYSRRPSNFEHLNTPSAPPPPLPLSLLGPRGTIASCRTLLEGLCQARELLVADDAGWTKWEALLEMKAVSFQRARYLSYVRSLWQSVICTEGIIGLQYPLDWIAGSFLEKQAGVERGTLSRLAMSPQATVLSGDTSQASLTKRVKWFMERLASQLVNHLCTLAQNRSRGRRSLAASYPTLLELSAEAAAIDVTLSEAYSGQAAEVVQLAPAIQVLTLGTMEHIVYSGFELELYRMEEHAIAYWVAHRIAEEKVLLIESMQVAEKSERKDVFIETQLHWTKALAAASVAMEMLYSTRQMVCQSRLPWCPADEDEKVLSKVEKCDVIVADAFQDIDKASFCKRFKWLRGKGRPEGKQTLDNLWEDLQAERSQVEKTSVGTIKSPYQMAADLHVIEQIQERLDRSAQYLSEAIKELKQVRRSNRDVVSKDEARKP